MSRRPRKRASIGRFGRPALAVALLGVGLTLAIAFVGITIQNNGVARDKAGLTADIAFEEIRHAALEAAAAEKASSAYVQDKARELGYVKPGEAIITVDSRARPQATPAAERSRPDRFARWVQLFFGTR
ncbi:MAG: hypothetical protein FJ034_05790 [Chloroflexi bacterium]|nr:hypothetical protein [Chloroflexota bacterium]